MIECNICKVRPADGLLTVIVQNRVPKTDAATSAVIPEQPVCKECREILERYLGTWELGVRSTEETEETETTLRSLQDENPSQELARLAGAKMAEMNLTYGQAADYILENNPDLAKAYRDYTIISLAGGEP